MNKFLTCTAVGLVMSLTPALAQDTSAPNDGAQAPAMQQAPSQPSAPSAAPTDAMPREITPDSSASNDAHTMDMGKNQSAQFLKEQNATDWLASDLIGKTVVNRKNETIGEINDLVTDQSGKIQAALVGAGGFLGIGEKNVAVRFEDLELVRDGNDTKVMMDTNKETLTSAPDFRTLDEQPVVEGSADREAPANSGSSTN